MFCVTVYKAGEHVGNVWRDDHDALLLGDLSRPPAVIGRTEAEEFVDHCESSVFLDYDYHVVTYEELLSGLVRTPAPRPRESSTPVLRAGR